MQKDNIVSKVAHYLEEDFFYRVSIFRSMAQDSKNAPSKDSASKDNGTEVRVHSFSANEDAVVPSDEEIVSVEHDRQMGITRVVTKRSYDAERSAKEKADAAGPPATPTYPQTAGAVNAPPEPPVTSFAWGSIDTSKVQNAPTVAAMPPTIAAQEADTAQAPRPEALLDEAKANEKLEDKSAAEAASESASPEDSETLKAAKEVAEEKAPSNPDNSSDA